MREVLMSEGIKEPKPFIRDSKVLVGLCLWVIHADKIPPHIGLSFNGRYYSLKANGVDLGIQPESLLKVIDSRSICTLIYELDAGINTSLSEAFSYYESTIPGSVTCLNPIKDVLDIKNADKLHQLLAELQNRGAIRSVYGMNVKTDFKGIPDYDLADIHNRLDKLNETQRR